MKLLELNTHEFARLEPRLCFWPVGTLEAHDLGPLGTDVIAPEKLSTDLAPEFNAVLIPTLPYGLVSSLSGYPGGMWMSADTYKSLIFELLSSLALSGVESMIVFNGHGGNTQALSSILPEVWKETGLKTAFVDWWTVGKELADKYFGSAAGHGGADELALVYAAKQPSSPPSPPSSDAPPERALPFSLPQKSQGDLSGTTLELSPSWDGSRSFLFRDGVKAYPSPRSAIRYSSIQPKPFTPESALEFYEALKDTIRIVLKDILSGWEEFSRLGR